MVNLDRAVGRRTGTLHRSLGFEIDHRVATELSRIATYEVNKVIGLGPKSLRSNRDDREFLECTVRKLRLEEFYGIVGRSRGISRRCERYHSDARCSHSRTACEEPKRKENNARHRRSFGSGSVPRESHPTQRARQPITRRPATPPITKRRIARINSILRSVNAAVGALCAAVKTRRKAESRFCRTGSAIGWKSDSSVRPAQRTATHNPTDPSPTALSRAKPITAACQLATSPTHALITAIVALNATTISVALRHRVGRPVRAGFAPPANGFMPIRRTNPRGGYAKRGYSEMACNVRESLSRTKHPCARVETRGPYTSLVTNTCSRSFAKHDGARVLPRSRRLHCLGKRRRGSRNASLENVESTRSTYKISQGSIEDRLATFCRQQAASRRAF